MTNNNNFENTMIGYMEEIRTGIVELKEINRQQVEINKEVADLLEGLYEKNGINRNLVRLEKANVIMEDLLRGAN